MERDGNQGRLCFRRSEYLAASYESDESAIAMVNGLKNTGYSHQLTLLALTLDTCATVIILAVLLFIVDANSGLKLGQAQLPHSDWKKALLQVELPFL
uniref:Uncharacterized protein n=1 Tax=Mycena chlorophos TaxID=658473 RepID=A0ABQ0LT96_MYCCL|nr:predicted protein [Mycena chlorophos]